jgi:biotin carboxyl carrier protein
LPVYEIFIDGKPRKIELTKTSEGSFTAKIDDEPLSIELPSEKLSLEKEFSIKIDGKNYRVGLHEFERDKVFPLKVEEASFKAEVKTPARKSASTTFEPAPVAPTRRAASADKALEGDITAPMTGKILSVRVSKGDQVKANQIVCVLEAMKMENEIAAPRAGTVQEVYVSEGSSVSEGEVLLRIG